MTRKAEVGKSENSYRPAVYQLLQVSALMLKTREHYAAAVGVTPPQFSILTAISERPGTSVGEVASRLHVTGPFVTAEVNKLVRAGLVIKVSSTADRRVVELRITQECAAKLAAVAPMRETANEMIFARLIPQDLVQFSDNLLLLIGGLEEALHMLARPSSAGKI